MSRLGLHVNHDAIVVIIVLVLVPPIPSTLRGCGPPAAKHDAVVLQRRQARGEELDVPVEVQGLLAVGCVCVWWM